MSDVRRVALVTGGSRGIGAAIVDRFAARGLKVYFNYFQDHDAAQARVHANAAQPGMTAAVQSDLRDAAEVEALVEHIGGREGRLDVLVCNAASGVFREPGEFRAKHWSWTLDTNARSFLLLVQHALPLFDAAGGGAVIAVSSLGAVRAIPGYAMVGASKAALESLVRHFAVALAPRGIAVNAVSPGLVETDGISAFFSEDDVEVSRRRTPAGRLTSPSDVCEVVEFLADPASRMVCGQTLIVDGGYSVVA